MKVKILRDTVADGKPVFKDQVCDLPDADAVFLLRIKKAELYTDPPPAPEKDKGRDKDKDK